MSIQIYPLQLSPTTLGMDYQSETIMAIGGTAPYRFVVSGQLPPGVFANTAVTSQLTLAGRPVLADQYANSGGAGLPVLSGPAYVPVLQNPSTFTVTVTDAVAATATQVYTLPVGVLSEDEAISVYEMLKACYGSDWYIVMSDMGTRTIKIGDIGNAGFGGIRLVINAYLNSSTAGMIKRQRKYIREFDRLKLLVQEQSNASVSGITGINYSFKEKLMKLLELAKTTLPACTRAEVEARQAHGGGSDFTSTVTGGKSGGSNNIRLSR